MPLKVSEFSVSAAASLSFLNVGAQSIFDGRVYWNNITRVLSVPYSPPSLGNIPVFSNVQNRKEKRLKNKDDIFFWPLKISETYV